MRGGVHQAAAIPVREFVVDRGIQGQITVSNRVFAMSSGTLA